MTLLTTLQNKINTKIFTRLGSTVVRTPYSSESIDKWGDETVTYGDNENVTAVPYNFISAKDDFMPFGELADGEIVMAFKHSQTLSINDLIVYDSKTFIIKEIEKFPLSDGNVLKVARMAEQL